MESPQRLSRRAKAVFAGTRYEREVSALSLSEIAIKNRRGLFEIFERDLSRAGRPGNARPAYSREHGLRLFGLPWHHADPFDRQILAQAFVEDIPIVTSDEVFERYPGVRVIW
jgi:PIN domain nuclease of toxin-antitoxin system